MEIMKELIPQDEWTSVIEPYYHAAKRGRPPRGVETMCSCLCFHTGSTCQIKGVEDAIYDSYALRKFMQVDLFCPL
jgi:IS5 family transposase